jgi:hypothetical protein
MTSLGKRGICFGVDLGVNAKSMDELQGKFIESAERS